MSELLAALYPNIGFIVFIVITLAVTVLMIFIIKEKHKHQLRKDSSVTSVSNKYK